jgi:hypothetical protein
MGFPIVAAITAGAQLAGQGINALTQSNANRKQEAFSREMYATQRKDSLADWTMQNEYNSPAEQMKRLQLAGLNPNLVYGNGAVNTAQPNRATQAQSISPQASKFDLGSITSMYFDTQMRQQQLDNLKTQNSAIAAETALKIARETGIMTDNQLKKFNLDYQMQLAPTSLDIQKQNLRNLQTTGVSTADANKRANEIQPLAKDKMSAEILNLAQTTAKSKTDQQYVQLQKNIAENNRQLETKRIELANAKTDEETKQIQQTIKGLEFDNSQINKIIKTIPALSPIIQALRFFFKTKN